MTRLAMAVAALPRRARGGPVLLAGVAALAALALLFRTEAAAALRVWRDSTAYSHCFLVLPIVLWLAWDRREAVRGLAPRPTPWPLLAMLPCGLAWFAAERLGLMEGRQLAALGLLEALLVALLGWRLARIQAPALFYLVFLVPVGGFLVPALQRVTAGFVDVGLELAGIPHVVDQFVIEIPEATFYVAEACAGLRFLIAALAFGALYALLCYRSPGRRLLFLAACGVVPILANGLRALGIVLAGHWLGSAEAAVADHLIYGWGFFSAIIFILALAGLPFRQAARLPAPPARPAPAAGPAASFAVAGLAVALAAAGPAAAWRLDRPDAPPDLSLPGFVATDACRPLGAPSATDAQFDCAGMMLSARLAILPAGAPPALLRARRAAAEAEAASAADAESRTHDAADVSIGTLALDEAGLDARVARRWRLAETQDPPRLTATCAWVLGAPEPAGLRGRLLLAWRSLRARAPSVLVVATLRPPSLLQAEQRAAARLRLGDFLRAQGAQLAAIEAATRAP
jgi:exosortase A